jgi:hypothetical protein
MRELAVIPVGNGYIGTAMSRLSRDKGALTSPQTPLAWPTHMLPVALACAPILESRLEQRQVAARAKIDPATLHRFR